MTLFKCHLNNYDKQMIVLNKSVRQHCENSGLFSGKNVFHVTIMEVLDVKQWTENVTYIGDHSFLRCGFHTFDTLKTSDQMSKAIVDDAAGQISLFDCNGPIGTCFYRPVVIIRETVKKGCLVLL
jgi:hypothetical protein